MTECGEYTGRNDPWSTARKCQGVNKTERNTLSQVQFVPAVSSALNLPQVRLINPLRIDRNPKYMAIFLHWKTPSQA
jgi:hypothetical protein